jgi:hypothetical protein
MRIVKSLAAAAVLALAATGPALADCSYSKQDTTAEAQKPAEVAAAPTVATPAAEPTTPAATEIASATSVETPTVKPN